jgi:hypothetical protein
MEQRSGDRETAQHERVQGVGLDAGIIRSAGLNGGDSNFADAVA